MNILVSRHCFCAEVFPRGWMEQTQARILVVVRSIFPEIRKMSKGHGFLGNTNYPRVSRHLRCTLTEYIDGQQVNIPVLTYVVR